MQKITVEIVANGFTGLTAENIEKALGHYFGSPSLRVSFAVTEAAQQSVQADECQEPCELGCVHEFAPPVVICSKCGTRR